MKKVNHKYPKCTVVWADHHDRDRGDYEANEVKEMAESPVYYEFTGYLINETDDCIAVGSNIRNDGLISNPTSIMINCIIEWEVWDV